MAKEPEKLVGELQCPECHSTNTEILHGEGFLTFKGYNIRFDCLSCGYRATVSGVNQRNAWRNLEEKLADSEVIIDNNPQYKRQELADSEVIIERGKMKKTPEQLVGRIQCPECGTFRTTVYHGENYLVFGGYQLKMVCDYCGDIINVSSSTRDGAFRLLDDEITAIVRHRYDNDFALYIDHNLTTKATCPFKQKHCTYDCALASLLVNKDKPGTFHENVYVCGLLNTENTMKLLYSKGMVNE